MFKKFSTVFTVSLTLLFAGAPFNVANSNPNFAFDEIMEMMVGADVRYERLGRYSNIPFKLKKKGDRWVFTQMRKMYSGTIKSAGGNKILVEGFGPCWTILGTWQFKKNKKLCRIDHTLRDSTCSEPMNTVWECRK